MAGVPLLMGRRGGSPELSAWVSRIVGGAVSAEIGEEHRGTEGAEFSAVDVQIELSGPDGRPLRTVDGTGGGDALTAAKVIIQEAVREQATDVHLEPEPGKFRVRYRVDGLLQTRWEYPPDMALSIVSALKVLANMDVAEKRRAQDGSFSGLLGNREVDFRVSTVGTSHGEKMVVRVLDKQAGLMKLQNLGLSKRTYEQLHSLVGAAHGMLIVCGPTGSGKTTTLYAALQEVDRRALNVIAIENPIEYHLDNVSQHAINEKAGITFASLLRTSLRQDPDVLMVGEVRDKETAEIAMQAAMTGHFVYTTMHANNTVSAVFRLVNLGLPPYLISTSVSAIVAQRLVRKLCMDCRVKRPPTPEELKEFGSAAKRIKTVYAAKGCAKCKGTGYRGRIGVFELLVLNDELRSLIQENPTISALKEAARKAGLVRLHEDALRKAAKGLTTVEEATRITN